MIRNNLIKQSKRKKVCVLLMVTMGMLAACGQDALSGTDHVQTAQAEGDKTETSQASAGASVQEQVIDEPEKVAKAGMEPSTANEETEENPDMAENPQMDEIKNRFGENCIAEQTFETQLGEYDGKVWFVPYAPAEEGQELNIQIVQDGEILTQLRPYVPEELEGQPFTSLDAVSFFDINCDNNTDIVLIETYGNTSFAAVYYGFSPEETAEEQVFMPQWSLSETITSEVNPLTIGELRNRLGRKSNGDFTTYQEAYAAAAGLWELAEGADVTYRLIYVDEDDTPELAVGVNGFWISLYTYHEGKVYLLMDQWGYGVMGNVGYEYIPKGNRIRNYNNDYAGAIHYTTYLTINDQYSIETVMEIVTYNFDDANGNGMPDEEEQDSIGYYGVSYVNGEEITNEQYAAYDAGEYEFIVGDMSFMELMTTLGKE